MVFLLFVVLRIFHALFRAYRRYLPCAVLPHLPQHRVEFPAAVARCPPPRLRSSLLVTRAVNTHTRGTLPLATLPFVCRVTRSLPRYVFRVTTLFADATDIGNPVDVRTNGWDSGWFTVPYRLVDTWTGWIVIDDIPFDGRCGHVRLLPVPCSRVRRCDAAVSDIPYRWIVVAA